MPWPIGAVAGSAPAPWSGDHGLFDHEAGDPLFPGDAGNPERRPRLALMVTNTKPVINHNDLYFRIFREALFCGIPVPIAGPSWRASSAFWLLHYSVYGRRSTRRRQPDRGAVLRVHTGAVTTLALS